MVIGTMGLQAMDANGLYLMISFPAFLTLS